MKPLLKAIIFSTISLVIGVLIGGFSMVYFVGNLNRQFVTDWGYKTATYNASNNIRLLYQLRKAEYDFAINRTEQDLDANIILLGSLLDDPKSITENQQNEIIKQIKAVQKYRSLYERRYEIEEIESRVKKILNQIK